MRRKEKDTSGIRLAKEGEEVEEEKEENSGGDAQSLPWQELVDFAQGEEEDERWKLNEYDSDDLQWFKPPDKLHWLKNAAVVVIAYNRPEMLRESLEALHRAALGKDMTVYVSQDGDEPAVTDVARGYEAMGRITHLQHPRKTLNATVKFVMGHKVASRPPGTMYLAAHYKWALDQILVEKEHTHAIIVEDDMLVSKDFLSLFEQTAPLLDADPSLWCVSSWNDNGYEHLELDPKALFRTSFFPGLGWMLKSETWSELRKTWPVDQWDHWMRAWSTSKGRECIVPELSRNRNVGAGGATSNGAFFRRHIQRISHHEKGPVGFGDLERLLRKNYAKRLADEIADPETRWLTDTGVSFMGGDDEGDAWSGRPRGKTYVVPYLRERYELLSRNLGVYSSPRAYHQYAHVLSYQGRRVILVDRRLCSLLPAKRGTAPAKSLRAVVAPRTSMSCNDVCEALDGGWECARAEFDWVNQCRVLSKVFDGCPHGCRKDWGKDIPNLERFGKGENPFGGNQCLVTEEVPTCEARHAKTQRLCPCTLRGGAAVVQSAQMEAVAGERPGHSCNDVCSRYKNGEYVCDETQFRYVNKCEALREHFPCTFCDQNHGKDIPNYVADRDDPNFGKCLVQREPPTCDGRHSHTRRLCPCVPQ